MRKVDKRKKAKLRRLQNIKNRERNKINIKSKKTKLNDKRNSSNLKNEKNPRNINKNNYKNNHYVPIWYQERFFTTDQKNRKLFYLKFFPDKFIDSNGGVHYEKDVTSRFPNSCFCEEDLYTLNIGNIENHEIEKYFFGKIDSDGRKAVKYFNDFTHPSVNGKAFQSMILYMSTQKLRTPKGLDWLSSKFGRNKHGVLNAMLRLRSLHGSAWTECVWQIADASKSNTKFIISDHPVTVYNRVCGPRSQRCRESRDPEIWLNGTHTIFPLSLDKVLILTNLSWVRNPYQSETSIRPNPNPWRGAIFKFTDVQTSRYLSEQEVCEINYIIKKRAFRFIAAAKEEWLYPEKKIKSTEWNSYGYGYLLMPDPRPVNIGGQIYIGYKDGTSDAFDEYGRKPWQKDFKKESDNNKETNTLYRFKGEFARLFGPYRRGLTFEAMHLDKEKDSDDFHSYHLGLEKKRYKK